MRLFSLSLLAFFALLAGPVSAAEQPELSGLPAVLPSGIIMVEGHDVTLWGVDSLAPDQECWHENHAWDCGEQALQALRHLLAGHHIRCDVKSASEHGCDHAQCFLLKAGKEEDVARYMVMEGWARVRADDSEDLYLNDQELAQRNRRGIWTSRFQSAEDWKNGVPRYVEYDMAPPRAKLSGNTKFPQ